MKPVYFVLVAIFLAYLGGCMPDPGTAASVTTEQSKACYADAQQQLSPQWANASKLDRAIAAFTVITTCEGSN